MKQSDLNTLCKLLLEYKTELAETNRQTEAEQVNTVATLVACARFWAIHEATTKKCNNLV